MLSQKNHKLLKPHYQGFFGIGYKEDDLSSTGFDLYDKVDFVIKIKGVKIKVQEKTCTELGYLTVVCGVQDFMHSRAQLLTCGYTNAAQTGMDAVMICPLNAYREFCRRYRDSIVYKTGPNKGKLRDSHKWLKSTTERGRAIDFLAVPLMFLLDSDLGKELGVVRSYTLTAEANRILRLQREHYDLRIPACDDMIQKYGDVDG